MFRNLYAMQEILLQHMKFFRGGGGFNLLKSKLLIKDYIITKSTQLLKCSIAIIPTFLEPILHLYSTNLFWKYLAPADFAHGISHYNKYI